MTMATLLMQLEYNWPSSAEFKALLQSKFINKHKCRFMKIKNGQMCEPSLSPEVDRLSWATGASVQLCSRSTEAKRSEHILSI